jgi:hypothetical protein
MPAARMTKPTCGTSRRAKSNKPRARISLNAGTRLICLRGKHPASFGINEKSRMGAGVQPSLPAMVVRASIRLPRSPRVSQR